MPYPLPSAHTVAPAKATAMVLAAGRGARMRPLTDCTPKPLLMVRGSSLLERTLQALANGGTRHVVVNTGWLGDEIESQIGLQRLLGKREQLSISYSSEPRGAGQALETLGGIARALPLLADIFWLAAGDVFAPGFAFSQATRQRFAASDALAHLWLVPNPPQHPQGDFGISSAGLAINAPAGGTEPRFTYSTIGLYRSALFQAPHCSIAPGNPHGQAAPLAPLLRAAIAQGRVSAELYAGEWVDVGTPERLAALNAA